MYQNLDILRRHEPEYVLILAGDHVYKMDYGKMLADHVARSADMTVGCIEVPLGTPRAFGVMGVDDGCRVRRLPGEAAASAGDAGPPDRALASMGIYVFSADVPLRAAHPRRRRPRLEPRLRQGHHSRTWSPRLSRVRPRLPAQLRRHERRPSRTGATWARSMPTGRRTWS